MLMKSQRGRLWRARHRIEHTRHVRRQLRLAGDRYRSSVHVGWLPASRRRRQAVAARQVVDYLHVVELAEALAGARGQSGPMLLAIGRHEDHKRRRVERVHVRIAFEHCHAVLLGVLALRRRRRAPRSVDRGRRAASGRLCRSLMLARVGGDAWRSRAHV